AGLALLVRVGLVRQRARARGPGLEAAGDGAGDAGEGRPKAGHATGSGGLPRAAPAGALDAGLLDGVAEVAAPCRLAPAGGEVGADDAQVPPGQLLAVGAAPGRGGADNGPAGRFRCGHDPCGTARHRPFGVWEGSLRGPAVTGRRSFEQASHVGHSAQWTGCGRPGSWNTACGTPT